MPLSNRDLSQKPWSVQVSVLAASFLLCFLFFSALIMLLVPVFTGRSSLQFFANTNYSDPVFMKQLIVVQSIYTVAIFGAPALLYARFASSAPASYLKLKPAKNNNHYVLGVLALLTSLAFVAKLAVWNQAIPVGAGLRALEEKAEVLTKALLNFKTVPKLLLTLFYIALLPAIAEELLFRGAIQQVLTKCFGERRVGLAIVITAIIFGAMHGQMLTVLPRIFLGIVLGYILVYSGSLWVCILAHFINNGLQVFLSYLHNIGKLDVDVNKNPDVPIYAALLSLAACVLCVWLMRRTSLKGKVDEQYAPREYQ